MIEPILERLTYAIIITSNTSLNPQTPLSTWARNPSSIPKFPSNVNDFLKSHVLPANRDYRPRFSFEEAARREIQVVPLDFITGTPQASTDFGGTFIRPLPSADVDGLLDIRRNPGYPTLVSTTSLIPLPTGRALGVKKPVASAALLATT